jgi:hypothetical protein
MWPRAWPESNSNKQQLRESHRGRDLIRVTLNQREPCPEQYHRQLGEASRRTLDRCPLWIDDSTGTRREESALGVLSSTQQLLAVGC